MAKSIFRRGVPYTTCDRTGKVLPYSDTVLEWTGLRVDKRWVDPRHPQDFVKTIKERQLLPGQKYITQTINDTNYNVFVLGTGLNNDYIGTGDGNFIALTLTIPPATE